MATELEIKLSVSEAAQARALEWLSSRPEVRLGESRPLMNRYFDTPDAGLNRAKAALRVRKAGDDYIQTLKTRGDFVDGAHRREEWEWSVPGPGLELSLLQDTPLNAGLDLSRLQPVFETTFQRQVLWLEDGRSLIEIAVDSGTVAGNNGRRPLHEVEFELKRGQSGKLVAWALDLAREVPVFLNLVSKAEQGYFLAGLYRPEMTHKREPLTVTEFLQVLGDCWLLGESFGAGHYDLSGVARAVGAAGCGELWKGVMSELGTGVTVRDLAESTGRLGILQLQLAATGQ